MVKRIADNTGKAVDAMIGNHDFLRSVKASEYADDTFGIPTVTDILAELAKPGRDPRPEFKTATFADGVNEVKDLIPGMVLEGSITNVTAFGAFVDIGVHQDGLVHISALSDKFISDPREVVKAGDVVKVKVMDVDLARKRIALSMRLNDEPGADNKPTSRGNANRDTRSARPQERSQPNRAPSNNNQGGNSSAFGGAFADAFAKAKRK